MMDSFINVRACERCGRLVAGTACVCESTGVGIGAGVTLTPIYTYTWICPKCGAQCQMPGFCPTCGWVAAPPPQPARAPWRCPGCGRYHAPHIDTCPFCQPHAAPNWPVWPYIGDPQPTYVGDPPWTITITTGSTESVGGTIRAGDPVSSAVSYNVEAEPLKGVVLS